MSPLAELYAALLAVASSLTIKARNGDTIDLSIYADGTVSVWQRRQRGRRWRHPWKPSPPNHASLEAALLALADAGELTVTLRNAVVAADPGGRDARLP